MMTTTVSHHAHADLDALARELYDPATGWKVAYASANRQLLLLIEFAVEWDDYADPDQWNARQFVEWHAARDRAERERTPESRRAKMEALALYESVLDELQLAREVVDL